MMYETKIAVVCDCMIYLQTIVNGSGPAAAVMKAVAEDRILLFYSAKIVAELRDVLFRPKLQQKFPNLTEERAEALFHLLLEKGVSIYNVPAEFVYERDPKDKKYINLALAAKADYLVSRDNDLLDLMNESQQIGRDFRARFPLLNILDPVTFLRKLSDERRSLP